MSNESTELEKLAQLKRMRNNMYYIIDYDTRTVECKGDDEEQLASYIIDNNLEMAVTLISSEDELCLELSFNEMKELYANITGDKKRHFDDDEHAADLCWSAIQSRANKIPTYNSRLGKKLIKEANKRCSDGRAKQAEATRKKQLPKNAQGKKKQVSGTRITRKQIEGRILTVGEVEPPEKGIPRKVREYLELCEQVVFEEAIEELAFELDKEEKQILPYIMGGIRKGFITVKE